MNVKGNQISFVARKSAELGIQYITLENTEMLSLFILRVSGSESGFLTVSDVNIVHNSHFAGSSNPVIHIQDVGFIFQAINILGAQFKEQTAALQSMPEIGAGIDDDCACTTNHPFLSLDGASGVLRSENIHSSALSAKNGALTFELVHFRQNKITEYGAGYENIRHNAFFESNRKMARNAVYSQETL